MLRLPVRLSLVCLAITLGLLCVFKPPTLVDQIELRILDWHARLRGHLPVPQNISIVAIGNYDQGAKEFEANKLLVKCPSKYQGAEVEKTYS